MTMKKIITLITLLLIPSICCAWGGNEGNFDRGNMTADQIRTVTVAKLGTAAVGKIAIVTDGSTSSDCSVGGGSNNNLCYYNGSSWVTITAGSFSVGSAVSGGTSTRVLFVDGSGNLADDADLTFSTDTLTSRGGVIVGDNTDQSFTVFTVDLLAGNQTIAWDDVNGEWDFSAPINASGTGQSALGQGLAINTSGGDTEDDDFSYASDTITMIDCDAGDEACTYLGYHNFVGGTMTLSHAITIGDGATGDVIMTFNGDAGTDGTFHWDVADDGFEMGGNLTIVSGQVWSDLSHFVGETSSADSDEDGYGQIWVKSNTPNVLAFTDDAGGDHIISNPRVTADPCAGGAYPIGTIFYNVTSNYMCFCGASNVDLKMNDNTTACF